MSAYRWWLLLVSTLTTFCGLHTESGAECSVPITSKAPRHIDQVKGEHGVKVEFECVVCGQTATASVSEGDLESKERPVETLNHCENCELETIWSSDEGALRPLGRY